LLAYVGTPPPVPAPHEAIALSDLPGLNLGGYDGPTIGLGSLDLVRPDLPTKGTQFYRLDRMLRQRGCVEILRQTWANLADHLSERLPQITAADSGGALEEQVLAEIAAIRAPSQLAAMTPEARRDLVAFVPAAGVAVRLQENAASPEAQLIALGDVRIEPADQVIAIEEVRPLLAQSDKAPPGLAYPIELRTELRRAGLDSELATTLSHLASAYHYRWTRSRAQVDLARAYAFALEVHLAGTDVDDLVAVLPEQDFDAFLRDGSSTYVYRRLPGTRAVRPGVVRRCQLSDAQRQAAERQSPVVFSLLPLRSFISAGSIGLGRWCDLGPVLRQIGRTEILARNAWLLVEDCLDLPRERRAEFGVTAQSLLTTMIHCCEILSLTDPWRTRQGRRNEWLLAAYATLNRVLGLLVEHGDGPADSYYAALDRWYGCALVDGPDLVKRLEEMVASLEPRRAESERLRARRNDHELAHEAEFLSAVGVALLDLLRGRAQASAYRQLISSAPQSIPRVLDRATDMSQRPETLAVTFRTGFQHYAALDRRIRRTRGSQVPVRDQVEQLSSYVDQLRQGRRRVFAPEHQARILCALYDNAIRQTEDLVQRLQGGASLEVEMRTRDVDATSDDAGLVFEVTNIGTVEARDVEVELSAFEAFELLDSSFKRTLARLGPEESAVFRFSVRALTDDEILPVRCLVSCADAAGVRQSRTLEFRVLVSGTDEGPFELQPNPYVFGLPLQDPRQFYGRRGELDQMVSHLASGRPQNILLRGARRMGKTSLLYMVRAVLADVDGSMGARAWFDLPQSWYQALDATAPVLLDLQAIEWDAGTPRATSFYRSVLQVLAEAGLRSERNDWLVDEPTVSATQFTQALQAILAAARGVRPVILVDEFDILDRGSDKSPFYGFLRHVISTVQGVTWIVAGALALQSEAGDYESPMFNVFKIINLGVIEPDAARRLIRFPWQEDGDSAPAGRLQLTDDAVGAILDEAGCYPYFVQLLCSEIVDYVNTVSFNAVVRYQTVVQVIERRMMSAGSPASEHFAYLWERARRVGRLVLLELLRRPDSMGLRELRQSVTRRLTEVGVETPLDDFDDTVRRLVVVHAVRRTPEGRIAFSIPLFRRLLVKRGEREDLQRSVLEEFRHG
jgi:hypothetical protein